MIYHKQQLSANEELIRVTLISNKVENKSKTNEAENLGKFKNNQLRPEISLFS